MTAHHYTKPRAVVEAPAGLAAFSLAIHGGRHCRPPLSRMGNKAGYTHALADIAGIVLGAGAGAYVWCEADRDVCGLLRAYPDPDMLLSIAATIRGWADEDPRALWMRLREERKARGPGVDGPVAEWVIASMWSYRQGDCDSGGPVLPGDRRQDTSAAAAACKNLAEYAQLVASNRLIPGATAPDDTWINAARGGATFGGADFATPPAEVADGFARVAEVAGWAAEQVRTMPQAAARGATDGDFLPQVAPSGVVRYAPSAPSAPIFALAGHASRWPPVLVSRRILTAAELSEALGTPGDLEGVLYYADPPYLFTTGYLADYPRADVVRDALAAAAMGARVMVSESTAVDDLVAHGWHATGIAGERKGQKRTFAANAGEVVTSSFVPVKRPGVQLGMFGGAA